jgi:RNA-directed DNA polymerase
MTERLAILTQVTRGCVNYFAEANAKTQLIRIDEWTRMRLRMCICKQWKRISTHMTNLQKLGVSKQQAYEWSNTRKGYCRTAHSPILQRTITNERLK